MLFLVQILRGLILALTFQRGAECWTRVNVNMSLGLIGTLRRMHAAMPVFVFRVMYAHIARSLLKSVGAGQWTTMASGLAILVLSYATAFLGYAMVFGNMGFWATTVIFQLLSFVPGLPESLYGDFTLSSIAVSKMFTLHYLAGLVMGVLAVAHLLVLQGHGSQNVSGRRMTVSFVEVAAKDAYALLAWALVLSCLSLGAVFTLVEGGNCTVARPSMTPAAIVPEAYLLSVYGVLKSMARKVVGILAAAALLVTLLH